MGYVHPLEGVMLVDLGSHCIYPSPLSATSEVETQLLSHYRDHTRIIKMSLTQEETPKAGIITLQNGQVFQVKSDTGKPLDSLPIIDVSGIYSENFEDRKAVAEQVRTAAHEIGFFYVINHVRVTLEDSRRASNKHQGIDPKFSGQTFEAAKRFFEQPTEKKMEVYTGLVPNEYVGYHPLEHYSRSGRKKKGKHKFPKQSNRY